MTTIYLITNDQVLTFETQPKLASGDENSVTLQVDFDEAWSGFAKSAVFFTENNKTVYEIIMVNDQCVVPWEVLTDAGVLYIGIRGVISDQAAVKTSTLVKYRVVKGAPVGDGTNIEPTADVYQQMLSMMDTFMSAEELAERAEAAATNAQSAAHNASASEGNAKTYATNAQSAAATATTKANETASARDTAVAAKEEAVESAELAEELMQSVLRESGNTASGETVRLENVLPDPYSVKVTARSKNLLPFPYSTTGYKEQSGGKFTIQGDGGIALSGTPTAYASIQLYNGKPFSKGVVTLSLQGTFTSAAFDIALQSNGVTIASPSTTGTTLTINFADYPTCDAFLIGIKRGANGVEMTGAVYVMVEEGEVATEWTPYVDITAVKSRNLIPYPYSETTKTVNGITFNVFNDGRIAVNGTATAQCVMKIVGSELALPNGTYFLSGCNSDASQTKGKFSLGLKENGSVKYIGVTASGYKFTISDTVKFEALYIEVLSGSKVDNLVVFPMINYGSTALPFEKHFEPRPLNLKSCGKNLIPYPYRDTTRAVNGITFTDNGDGSITVNGTATDRANFTLANGTQNNPLVPPGQTYTLSGTPKGDNNDCRIQFWDYGGDTQGNGHAFNFTNAKNWDHNIAISVFKGFTANNMVFYPQLELGAVKTEYEQYKAGETLDFRTADVEREFVSVSPNMTLIPDASGVVLEAVYNDTHAAFEKIKAECEKLNKSITALSNVVNSNLSDIDTLKNNVTTINSKISNHRNIYVTTQENPDVGMYQYGDIVGVIEGTS